MDINLSKYGFFRVAASAPQLKVADIEYNINNIKRDIRVACEKEANLILFTELCITGYTVGDLFFQESLLKEAYKGIDEIIQSSKSLDIIIVLGSQFLVDNRLYNCAFIIHKGNILGIIPKTHIPNYNEFYEKRYFESSTNKISKKVDFLNFKDIPFDSNILIEDETTGAIIGTEICEDLWTPIPPSSYHSLYGANIIVNLSASNELIGKSEYRKSLVESQSARTIGAYVYASASRYESTSDTIFSGHLLISENGKTMDEKEFTLANDTRLVFADIDVERLKNERIRRNSYMENFVELEYIKVKIQTNPKLVGRLLRNDIKANIFASDNKSIQKIIDIQTGALMKRMEHISAKHIVLGISGGLDSTLALLIAVNTFKHLSLPLKNIIAVTMPGFGTGDRTYNNAIKLINELSCTLKEISIKKSVLQHFEDIGHDKNNFDIVYENSQARERTQILMDIANQYNTIVLGTGNLSEIALGWCTYNADHMSMYGINSGVPKSLVKNILSSLKESFKNTNEEISKVLEDILDTPISPELLPTADNGEMIQKTENLIGNYELHDFFLYFFLRYGFTPKKILLLASIAFDGIYRKEEIKKWLKVFLTRFFNNQFKRNCVPDGIKIGSISLSPRSDWRMPSEAIVKLWIKEIE